MAQFDVYVNPQPNTRKFVPYVVDIQSALIDRLPTRLVVPLTWEQTKTGKLPVNLCPKVEIEGEALSLMPHLASPLGLRSLGRPVTSIASHGAEILAALDAVTSGV
jgi:toxin CcdB